MLKGTKLPRVQLINVSTGEVIERGQGGIPYYKALKEGYIPEESIPPDEENTDYQQVLPEDRLRDKIDALFDRLETTLETIPLEKVTYSRRQPIFTDLSEERSMLISMLNDLVGSTDDYELLDSYLTAIEPKVSEYITLIIMDSESDMVEFHITQIAVLLNNGQPLSFNQASTLGNMQTFKGEPLSWYEQSSRIKESF